MPKIAIVGAVGVPGRYGGFETLAENLARFCEKRNDSASELTIYCSGEAYPERIPTYYGSTLRYSRFKANGLQSVIYDAVTAIDAARRGSETILMLGVSGSIVVPILRLFSSARIVTNVDGIEWRRAKWSGLARAFLRLSEYVAVRFSHKVIADNQGIADHLRDEYGVEAVVIEYGGDHAPLEAKDIVLGDMQLPESYALALCRIEPENNVEMILRAFQASDRELVFVGNWDGSSYGRSLKEQFAGLPCLHLLDPIYEPARLDAVRRNASTYVHGHSAGGTNPSLVEMMHYGVPILAFDCNFNRYTTEDKAAYFRSTVQLVELIARPPGGDQGDLMREIAQCKYRWEVIGERYFDLFVSTR